MGKLRKLLPVGCACGSGNVIVIRYDWDPSEDKWQVCCRDCHRKGEVR